MAALLLTLAVASFQATSPGRGKERRKLETDRAFATAMDDLRRTPERSPEEGKALGDRFIIQEMERMRRQAEDAEREHSLAPRTLLPQTVVVAAIAVVFVLAFGRPTSRVTTASPAAGARLAVACLALYVFAVALPAVGGVGTYHGHPRGGVIHGLEALLFGALMVPAGIGLPWLANVAGGAGIVAATLCRWHAAYLLGSGALLTAIAAPLVLSLSEEKGSHVLVGFYFWVATFALLAAGSGARRVDGARPA